MDTKKKFLSRKRGAMAGRERGAVLLVAIIALVAMTLAGLALMRSVDTGNVIAGNMAFRQAALQQSDVGIEAAFKRLPSLVASSKNTNIANEYYAIRFKDSEFDSRGVPTAINWANVPCRDSTDTQVTCSDQEYKVKYVIDRLCSAQTAGSTTVTNIQTFCLVKIGTGETGSKGSFTPAFSSADAVYYRVTVQVTGPRNTTAYVQAILSIG
jgi:type IV pilus assembly protein PilX